MLVRSKKRWKVISRKRAKREDEEMEEKRLAKLMRGVRPQQRGGFHSPRKRAERITTERHENKQSLKDEVRRYNDDKAPS